MYISFCMSILNKSIYFALKLYQHVDKVYLTYTVNKPNIEKKRPNERTQVCANINKYLRTVFENLSCIKIQHISFVFIV